MLLSQYYSMIKELFLPVLFMEKVTWNYKAMLIAIFMQQKLEGFILP